MEPGAAKGGFILLALIGGAILPLQALINARLGAGLGGPIWAAMLSFLIGTITLVAFLLALRAPMPGLHATAALPWFRRRTEVATTVASVAWIGCGLAWWAKGWSVGGDRAASSAVPIAAVASSVVIHSRFRAESHRVDEYNRKEANAR